MPSLVRIAGALALYLGLAAAPLHAQDYPTQPVRILVGFTAGSGPDVLARTIATQLSVDLGKQFFVENQGGANGTLAIANLVKSAPDGHTLLYSSSSISPIPYIYKSLRYDILKDLAPIATIGVLDGLLVLVHPSSPVKTIADLVAEAKANRLVYGSPGIGNALHLAAELFNAKAGIKMDHVPFRGSGDVTNALLARSIHVMFVTPPAVIGLAQGGELRAIGFTGSKPYPELPAVPLVRATVPSLPVIGSWGMFYAPAGTPEPLVDKLNSAIRATLRVPAVAKIVQQAGYMPDERTAAQTAEFFRREVEDAREAVDAAGIKPN